MLDLITTCPICGRESVVTVWADSYEDWQNGRHAQDAFPYLTPDQREMLISGICPTCWDNLFGQENEEGDIPDDVDECGFDPYEGCYTYDC